mgnify:CR=1 FL=1
MKFFSKKDWQILFLGIVLLILLWTPVVAAEVTIDYWQFGGLLTEISFFQKRIQEFNAKNPGIKVVYTPQDWGTRREKMITSYQAGVAPDVISMMSEIIPEFGIAMGMFVPLDVHFPQGVKEYSQRVVKEALPPVTYEGHVWQIPTYIDLDLLGFNRVMFARAGLDPDKPAETMEEVTEFAKKLTQDKDGDGVIDVYGFAWPGGGVETSMWFRKLLWMAGGRWISEDGKKVVFNSPPSYDILSWYVDMYRKHKVMPPETPNLDMWKITEMACAGRVAMFVSGSWFPGLALDIGAPVGFPWAPGPLPRPGKTFSKGEFPPASGFYAVSTNFSMISTSKNKEAAWKFIEFMTSDETLKGWADGTIIGRVPISNAALESDKFQKLYPLYYKRYKEGKLFEGLAIMPAFVGITEMDKITDDAIASALLGKKTPGIALAEAAVKCQRVLDELME